MREAELNCLHLLANVSSLWHTKFQGGDIYGKYNSGLCPYRYRVKRKC